MSETGNGTRQNQQPIFPADQTKDSIEIPRRTALYRHERRNEIQ